MTIPNIPTDNLYKFVFIGGIALCAVSILWPAQQTHDATTAVARVEVQYEHVKDTYEANAHHLEQSFDRWAHSLESQIDNTDSEDSREVLVAEFKTGASEFLQ